jgi:hypothetical protein
MFHHDPSHTGTSTSTGPTTNNLLWSYTTYGLVESSPTVADGVVYVGSLGSNGRQGSVYALDASTGNKIWSYQTGSNYVYSSPAVAGGDVYIGSFDGNVYALDASTGNKIWNYPTGSWGVWSSPAVAGGVVYIGSDGDYPSNDGSVYALNVFTGGCLWSYQTDGSVGSSPAVANGLVYVGSNDGNVYAFGSLEQQPSNTAVSCSPNPAIAGSVVTCTATVSGSNPTGTVTWTTSSSTGSFSSSTSTLSSGSCSTTYTDTSAGSVIITASYSGDSNNAPSNGSTTLTLSGSVTTNWDPSRDSYSFGNYGPSRASDGVCYGMSSTAVLYFEQYFQTPFANPNAPFFPSQSPEAQNTFALNSSATADELNNVTLAILAHEIYDSQAYLSSDSILYADKANEFHQLASNLANGQPVVLALAYLFPHQPVQKHAVVAWAVKQLSDGTYNISVYDPTLYSISGTTVATYNPTDNTFAYYAYTSFYVIVPQPIQSSWFNNIQWFWAPSYSTHWLDQSVPNYYIVMADKSVTLESGGLKDYFTAQGDSRTFVCGIPGS